MNLLKWLPLQLLHGQNKTMTIKALYPTTRPTLDLNFAATKRLDPRITYSRASTGTFVGSNGLIQTAASGAARFDHNPATGESLGLLVEEARTNLLTYSSTLSSPWYFPYLTRVANAGVAPDGTSTASSFATTAVGGYNLLQPVAPTLLTSTNYCFSLYVKLLSGTGTASSISIGSNSHLVTPNYASYGLRLDNVTETTTGAVPSIKGYTALPNGWFRIYMVFNTAAQTNAGITIYVGDTTTNVASFLIWGAQLEAGSFPTSYIPTVASTVTRAADVASMTGTNFSSWYNQSEGTLFAAQRSDTIQDAYETSTFVLCSSNPNAHFIGMDVTNDYNRTDVYGNGPTASIEPYAPVTPGTLSKNAFAYQLNNAAAVRNGGTVFTDTSVGLPIVEIDRATIGHNLIYGNQKRQHLSRLTYYPVRLPDAQLQALTAT